MREIDVLSVLLRELSGPLRAALLDLDRLHVRVRRIVQKTRMLDIVRAELAGERESLPPFQRRTISKVIDSLDAIARSALVRDLDRDLAVLAAPGALDVVLRNLVRHVQHIPEAELAVRAYPLKRGSALWPAAPSVSLQDWAVIIEIAASGPSVSERLSSALFRLERSERFANDQQMLGLWLSRTIVRAHGGNLWIADTPHGPALVSIWPMAPAKPRPSAQSMNIPDCWPPASQDFARAVRTARDAAFLTREDFAREADIAASTLRNVETLRHSCKRDTRSKIINTFARLGIAPPPVA